jgi:hypothetical protein
MLRSTAYIQNQQLPFLYHTMAPTSRIPSVRTRLQLHEASLRKSLATNSPGGSGSVGVDADPPPPRVGIYGPVLRGRHTKSLEASILRSREDHASKTASGRGADEDHDQNNHDYDAKLVSYVMLCCQCHEISCLVYVFSSHTFYIS